MSTFTGLNTISGGISSHQLALNTVGHNITNADTPGYSRQNTVVSTRVSQTIYTANGVAQIGNGADVTAILRARDSFSDRQYWKENCTLGYHQTMARNYDKIESVLDDSDDKGIQNAINEFVAALENLDTAASTDSVRINVREGAKTLANVMEKAGSELRDLINDNVGDIELYVGKVNELTTQIAELNKKIVAVEGTGSMANDLRDSRDLLVDELSGYINVSVTERDNGAYTITSNGNTMVYNHSSTNLTCEKGPDSMYGTDSISIKIEGTDITFKPSDGKIKGYYDSIDECQNYLDKMSKIAAYLMTEFNEIHNSGFGLDDCATGVVLDTNGNPVYQRDPITGNILQDANGNDMYQLNYANNFFGEDSYKYTFNNDGTVTKEKYNSNGTIDTTFNAQTLTTAEILSEFAVNSKFDKEGGCNAIAAKRLPQVSVNGTQNGEDNAAGTNAALLSNAISKSRVNTADGSNNIFGGTSMTEFYISTITELGTNSNSTDNYYSNQEGIMEEIDGWRSDVSGVNWDEELSKMIMYQQGYKACSKCLTAMEEMLDTLISCV